MQQRHHRTLALAGAAVLALVVAAGCGGRDARADGDTANEAASSAGTGVAILEPAASPSPAATPPDATLGAGAAATEVPAPQATPAPPTAAPFVAPDLTAIERLLDDLDAALGADATADSDEGSAP